MSSTINTDRSNAKSGGLFTKVDGLRNPDRLDRDTAYGLWTQRGTCRLSPFTPIEELRYVCLSRTERATVLDCYRVQIREDGVAEIGESTMFSSFNLSLRSGERSRHNPAFLNKQRDPVTYNAAAKLALAVEVDRRFDNDRTNRHIPRPALPLPELVFGWPHPIPVIPSLALDQFVRGVFPYVDVPTAQHRTAAWSMITRKIRQADGRSYFIYPAKFAVPTVCREYAQHPYTGTLAPTEAAVGNGDRNGDWVYLDEQWRPVLPYNYTVFAANTGIAGVTYDNQAATILESVGLDPKGDVARQFAEDLLPGDRLTLANTLRSTLPHRVIFTLNDLLSAFVRPHDRVIASEEPTVASYPKLSAWSGDFWNVGIVYPE